MRTRLFGYALGAILVVAGSTAAMANSFQYYGHGCGGSYPYSLTGDCCHRGHGHGPCGDKGSCHTSKSDCHGDYKVNETTEVVREACPPSVHRSERHLHHTTLNVRNVVHEVEHPVIHENTTVHHNIQKHKTVHHYKHRTTHSERNLERTVNEDVNLGECSNGCHKGCPHDH